MAEILLPQMTVEKMDSLREAIKSIGKCVEADIQMKEVVNIIISWPGDRPDVGDIIKRLVGIKQVEIIKPTIQSVVKFKKSRQGRPRKQKDKVNPLRLSETKGKNGFHPLGS